MSKIICISLELHVRMHQCRHSLKLREFILNHPAAPACAAGDGLLRNSPLERAVDHLGMASRRDSRDLVSRVLIRVTVVLAIVLARSSWSRLYTLSRIVCRCRVIFMMPGKMVTARGEHWHTYTRGLLVVGSLVVPLAVAVIDS